MVYTIDLATLLSLLREFKRSGRIQANLLSGIPEYKERCQAFIELAQGNTISCTIVDGRGQVLLKENQALQALFALGVLDWSFEAKQPSPHNVSLAPLPDDTPESRLPALPPASPSEASRVIIPRRLIEVRPEIMSQWARRYRQVYVLVDGERSVEKIAAILSQPGNEVLEILRTLHTHRFIAF